MATSPMFRVTQVVSGVAGSPYYITGYFDSLAGDAQAAANAWRAAISPSTTILRSGLTYEAMSEVELVEPETGQTISIQPVALASVAFTSAGDPIPPSSQLLVRIRTGVYTGGREVRGRFNMPGWCEPESNGGAPILSVLTTQDDRMQDLIDDPDSAYVVWSRKYGSHQPVITASTWTKWSVLRSRRD